MVVGPIVVAAAALAAGCGFSHSGGQPGEDAGPIPDAPLLPDAAMPLPDAMPDAMIDAPPGTTCYGPGGWQVCLGTGLGTKTLNGTINTDTSAECLAAPPPGWGGLQPDACFIVAEMVTVGGLQAVGSRALAIVATNQLTVTGFLDVASRGNTHGAGSQSTECKPFLLIPANGGPPGDTGGGGGAGGSFMSRAGNGGTADAGNHQNGLAADLILGVPMRLRGGCAGQPGGGMNNVGAGLGGGAVYLVSGGGLTIMGSINASGGGGLGGVNGGDESPHGGGGGGGSGGLIVLYGASPIATSSTTVLVANGGGGGGGAAAGGDPTIANGHAGNDPLVTAPTTPAAGGAAGTSGGGDGGAGGSGYPAAAASTAGGSGGMNSGGAGGGGGAGYIQANQDLGQAQSSPPTTIR